MNNFNFDANKIILDNGIELITVKRNTKLASINLGVKIGALYENDNERGISHFIEHMLFKGTKNRNNEELNDGLENLGGEFNAYTDYTATVYSITCLEEEIKKATELLSDMIINSNFPKDEIEKERGVILSEIKTSKDDIEDLSFKRIHEIAFEKSNLKYEVCGTEQSIKVFKRDDLLNFYDKFYKPNNVVISFVSSLDHEDAIEVIKYFFGLWSGTSLKRNNNDLEKNKPIKKITYKRNIEQSTILYLYTFYELKKEKELAFKILNHKFGESSNSILFRELRENKGLAYDVYTHMDMTDNVKTLYIFTAVSEENVDTAIESIDNCIEKIKKEQIIFDDNTLNLMKKVHKTAVFSTLEDSAEIASYVLNQRLENEDIKEFTKDMKDLENISSEDIYEVGREILNNPTIHILKPVKGEEYDE